tara:strand:+ start:219 stop:476 length:258 start_codon:yes stop_codon:yes gene_type:complete
MMHILAKNKMATDPQNASDPRNADHHWFPFLRYQEQCEAAGKEATINEWLHSKGKLNHQIEYEKAKAEALNNQAQSKKTEETKTN